MLGQVYQDMPILELVILLETAKKSGSGSIQDFKDLIIKKYHESDQSFKNYVQEQGGWGFIGEDIAYLRFLLMDYNLYEPNKK